MRHVYFSILLLCAGIVLFSCDKSTEPVPVSTGPITTVTIESRDVVIGGIQYYFYIFIDSLAMNMTEARFCIGYDKRRFTFFQGFRGGFMWKNNWQFDSCEYIGSDPLAGDTNISLISIHLIKDTLGGAIVDTAAIHYGTYLYMLHFISINNISNPIDTSAIRFYWKDCGSNLVYFNNADKPARIGAVLDPDSDRPPWRLPQTWNGPASGCDTLFASPDSALDVRLVNGFETIWRDTLSDSRGDINTNGFACEIADAVMFTNYFIFGTAAFGSHVSGSTARSDVNTDGATLTIADFVYLVRIIVGDALPYPSPATPGNLFTATARGDRVVISTTEDAGAALFVFNVNGTIGTPAINNGLDVISNLENNELRVLVYNIGTESLTDGSILTIPINGTMELVEVEAATYGGAVMETSIRNLPTGK